jgi:hypothetical protein
MRGERRFAVVRIVLGLVLLTAAGLKLYGLNVTDLPRMGWFSTPRVLVAAVGWELVLGLWLLLGTSPAWVWLAAVGTFTTFAVASGYFGSIGVMSCRCFGVIAASPWTAFAVDVTALALLAAARPDVGVRSFRPPTAALSVAFAAAAVLFLLSGIGWWAYGSPRAALARLRGQPLTVDPERMDFGTGAAGDIAEREIEIRNWAHHPVQLTGGTCDGACTATADLPLVIPAGESRSIAVRLRFPTNSQGAFTRLAVLWTDEDQQPTIRLSITGRIGN